MFVYIWKKPDGVPFYVGMTKAIGRTNPLNSGGRGWLCKQTLETVGRSAVIVEIHNVTTKEAAQELERSFILQHGRIQLGTGTLTNLRPGGEGSPGMSEAERVVLSARMKEHNPVHNPDVRAKIKARMEMPDMQVRFSGENNPAKQPEVRAKLKAKWQDPEFRAARIAEKVGKAKHSDEHKAKLRDKLLDPANPMRQYHKVLNSDLTIKAKRVASLQSSEIRAKISARLKETWAKRKAIT